MNSEEIKTQRIDASTDVSAGTTEDRQGTEDASTMSEMPTKADKKKLKQMESELAGLRKELEVKEDALAAEKDKYMRMIAEYDNFRKRTQKEKENTYADAYADAINAILPVLDNLERAECYHDPEAVQKGVSMTLKAARDTFQKLGITEIETKVFDPNLHNAVLHVEDDLFGEGEIVEVLQKGYCKGDRIIRYAMVKVAN